MPMWLWVKDPSTGHEFDVQENSPLLRKGLVTRVKPVRYPPSPVRRRTKHHKSFAGQSAARSQDASTGAPTPANPEEN